MSKIKKYELVSSICGFTGMFIMGACIVSVIWTKDSNMFVSLIIGLSAFIPMIPMIIYSKKSYKLTIEMVKNMDEVQRIKWVTSKDNIYGADRIFNAIGGYEQKWVKVDK